CWEGVHSLLDGALAEDVQAPLDVDHPVRVLARDGNGGVSLPADDLVDRVERDERGDLNRAAMGRGCSPTEGCHAHEATVGPRSGPAQCGYPYFGLRPSGVF